MSVRGLPATERGNAEWTWNTDVYNIHNEFYLFSLIFSRVSSVFGHPRMRHKHLISIISRGISVQKQFPFYYCLVLLLAVVRKLALHAGEVLEPDILQRTFFSASRSGIILI